MAIRPQGTWGQGQSGALSPPCVSPRARRTPSQPLHSAQTVASSSLSEDTAGSGSDLTCLTPGHQNLSEVKIKGAARHALRSSAY